MNQGDVILEINKLKTFIDLAQTLSFSETAANLYTEQSTVSKHIHSLETELGMRLFNRSNRKVRLSAYGQAVLPLAKQMVHLNQQMFNQRQEFQKQEGTIHLGVIPTFGDYTAFQKTMNYHQKHPGVHLKLQELEMNVLLDQLSKGKIDLAFVRLLRPSITGYEKILTNQDQFTVCLPKAHPLAKQAVVQLTDLKNENFISLTKVSLLNEPVSSLCQKVGFQPQVVFSSDRLSTIIQMVAHHQGVAILMHKPSVDRQVVFRPLQPTRTSYLMFLRKKHGSSKAAEDFWQYLQRAY